jgi:hypothetical protein
MYLTSTADSIIAVPMQLLGSEQSLYRQGEAMDLNVRAFRLAQEATAETPYAVQAGKTASRKGGLLGGPARASSISRARRVEIAKQASDTRWKKSKANG